MVLPFPAIESRQAGMRGQTFGVSEQDVGAPSSTYKVIVEPLLRLRARMDSHGHTGTHLAVVDDDPGVRKALARLLSVFGYRAELFASAPHFLRAAPMSKASCLVVDIQLGDMSGLALARQLSAAGFEFPIIFMSGSEGEAALRQSTDVGCVSFLRKPFPQAGLIDTIAKAIRSDLPVA